jgi:DNA-binding response OmpR family regulator
MNPELPSKILVVEDEEQNLTFLEQVLRQEKHAVVKARDGIEALDKFDKCQPDLVLLDLMMPRLNGYDVCCRLKHNPHAQSVPILLMTGIAEHEARVTAFQMGVDDFLVKPLDADELLARVRALLRVRFGMQALARLNTARTDVRAELAHAMEQLDQIYAHLQAHPDAQLSGLITKALCSCKRLDLTLAQL